MTSLALCAVVLALAGDSVIAKPVQRATSSHISLPFARRMNTTGIPNLLAVDQARAKALKNRSSSKGTKTSARSPLAPAINVPADNQVVDYVATVLVGNPPTEFFLLIDTGSSNTWVGATTPFTVTSTTVDTGNEVEVIYGSGFFFGEEVTDQVQLANGLTITNQSIGVAELAFGFDGVDGILGIGPVDLTVDTLFPDDTDTVPTVIDNAFAQGLIDERLIGISFEPTDTIEALNGELTFGGINTNKFTGEMTFVPITSTAPASEFVGIDQTVTYGAAGTPILATTAGITDTGTTLLLLATDAIEAYQTATGAVLDDTVGLLRLTPDQFASLESLFFQIGDTTFEFTPNAQIFPRALNTAIGGTDDFVYLIAADLGSPSGEGFDFVDGMTFLERFYYVFDSANSQVGFATTEFTDSTIN
ncbi:acid protease [Epithele typhae]|uniref:acid protease n=1 Tax=Epithele typhae TaxID=378194 RepID=UPI00200777C4|nr:acid protease [Epithele typhae]KAH9934558.1 acid protease [Epithele typhae]